VFSAAAAFFVALAVIGSKTFNLGYFGDGSIPVFDSLFAAQSFVLAAASVAFVLAALFAERRWSEMTLKLGNELLRDSNERLELALDAAELGAFRLDLDTGLLECDARTAHIHGHLSLPKTIKEGRRFVHPDDRVCIDTPFAEAQSTGSAWRTEYRVVHPPGHPHAGKVRWVAFEGSTACGVQGKPGRLLGISRDITHQKRAERTLAERNAQLALAGRAGLVGTYAHDINMDMMQVSEGYAAIHGLPEGTTESSRSEWKRRAHPEDLARKLAVERKAFRERRGEYNVEYRIDRHGEVRWIESRSFISYDSDGSPQRVVGVNIDITERKRAEEQQDVLIAELDHRVKNVLATVSAVAAQTLETSSSMSHFVAALDGRIRSMAAAHELLSTRQWMGMPMAELVRRELAAYASNSNTKMDGPEVMLNAEAGQAMAMVIHELVTNAAKYGALSTQAGHVSVRWYRQLNGSAQLVLVWQETGGPTVEAPRKPGYGTGVIRDLIPYEFGGKGDLSFAPEGVRCRLEIPFDRVRSDSRDISGSARLHHAGQSSVRPS
jgi:PAS domain S-box-containing protein